MVILVVDDDTAGRYALAKALRSNGRTILEAEDGDMALAVIEESRPDLVFLDLVMPKKDGLSVLNELTISSVRELPEIIIVTASDSIANAVECIRRGATDFLAKPYEVEHVRSIANRAEKRVKLEQEVMNLKNDIGTVAAGNSMIGSSRVMRALSEQINRAAKVNLPVLIRGESGTGKELVARELHRRSERKHGPFVPVNTAAISSSLIESELFGHVKGAYTGADRPRVGVFRQANGGTLFLDEIGDMPPAVQTRLLRVLQERVVQPVGSEELIEVDVRVLSATHQDLEAAIEAKTFRQDLYYRLCGIELSLPPLRHRQEDILLLANTFLSGKHQFDRRAIESLITHLWPGNVRELKQRVESAAAMCDGLTISSSDLGLTGPSVKTSETAFDAYMGLPLTEAKDRLVEDFERAMISKCLEDHDHNVSAAARALGIHRQSLQQKVAKLGLT